ncbi:hypothetical protein GCM10010124_40630 [Pilimelia terevasa]|uniref:M23ase beta-sheet core domain-containing protein n=1 Tax=Pilimelia terevasa TaxID=53372 RepID=A0A8J3BVU0_9ACTN|nr:M23 family metallopeptidase [Pilimelia terevasa]GGK43727.1 hypothetical protein GCM10010124_40630 [Pilimelia terevasa]
MSRVVAWSCGGALAVLLLFVGAAAGVLSAGGGGTGGGCLPGPAPSGPAAPGLSAEQAGNAEVIVGVGRRLGVPPRGWVVAVATALQESDLINLGHRGVANDNDSLGLFQQRPSMGWGTPAQLTNPAYAAEAFYRRLLTVDRWQELPVTVAAQRVQRSAFPDAYARHEARATAIVGGNGAPVADCVPGAVGAHGWVRPAPGPLVSGYRTAARPGHDGVDLGAPRGAVVRAAGAGVVATVLCNVGGVTHAPNGRPSACDRDGSPSASGCGWYVDVRHGGNVTTRYCHLGRAPGVRVGQPVAAGTPLGVVGSSGNSSGPHLHFEVHRGFPATSGNAVEPEVFLARVGVRL